MEEVTWKVMQEHQPTPSQNRISDLPEGGHGYEDTIFS
jgi:hypothetical protein